MNIFSLKYGAASNDPRRFNGAVYVYYEKRTEMDLEKGRKMFTRNGSVEADVENYSGEKYFPVLFDQDIRIEPNKRYTVCAVVSVSSLWLTNYS